MTTLILAPTPLELSTLEPLLSPLVRRIDGILELCGFGPVASSARTMQLIALHRPKRVVLVGIAGSLRPELDVGTARSFRKVACDGIGVGMGTDHKLAGEMGWSHWVATRHATDEPRAEIGDVLPLEPNLSDAQDVGDELLTVCAASANAADVAMRLDRHTDALAEDMEGFGVAVACYFGAVPLQIIRGISNRAGDRDKANWDIDRALHAAGELALKACSA